MRISLICPRHGYIRGEFCPHCVDEKKGSPVYITTHDWVTKQTWSDIDPANPNLKVSSKRELIQACERTGNYTKAFMKPKSQGQGWEHKRRGA
jgi:hypothetical protein